MKKLTLFIYFFSLVSTAYADLFPWENYVDCSAVKVKRRDATTYYIVSLNHAEGDSFYYSFGTCNEANQFLAQEAKSGACKKTEFYECD